jgi:hypothetical protein
MLTLDVPYIFDAVGGPMALLDLLQRGEPGTPLNYAAVQMWRQRRSIPAAWIVPLIYIMTQRGHALGELLVDEQDPFGVGDVPIAGGLTHAGDGD